jgi:hypothetical protein
MSVEIAGNLWDFRIIPGKQFVKRNGVAKQTDAVCSLQDRVVTISASASLQRQIELAAEVGAAIATRTGNAVIDLGDFDIDQRLSPTNSNPGSVPV